MISNRSRTPEPSGNETSRLADDPVVHQVEEIGLGGDVGVERHGADPEALRDPAHRDRVHALLVGDLDRGGDDVVQGKAGFRTALRRQLEAPEEAHAAPRVDPFVVLGSRHALRPLTTPYTVPYLRA